MAESPRSLTTGERLGLYGKAIVASFVSAAGAYVTAAKDGPGVTPVEWLSIGITWLGSLAAVWAIPGTNKVLAGYGKLLVAGLVAAASSLITGLTDGSLDQTEIIVAVVAFISAAGLAGTVSNAAASDPHDDQGRQVAFPAATKAAVANGGTAAQVTRTGNVVELNNQFGENLS